MFSCFGACCDSAYGEDDVYARYTAQQRVDLYERCIARNNGRLIVHGLFARADAVNTNKRVYPKRTLKREVSRYTEQHIHRGTALGELDHPAYASDFFRVLNLPNLSHQVLEVYWRRSQLWGTIEVLPTPSGLLLRELYAKGLRVGVSSRGWASLVRHPVTQQLVVDDDFQLITFDFVPDPSNSGAFLYPMPRRYRRQLPDQQRVVQLAHMQLGSVPILGIPLLPAAQQVQQLLLELKAQRKAQKKIAAQQQQQQQQEEASQQQQQQRGRLTAPPVAVTCGEGVLPPGASCGGSPHSTHPAARGVAIEANSSSSRGCSAGVVAYPAVTSTPLNGGFRCVSHYHMEPPHFLIPCDPHGRSYPQHLTAMVRKVHLAEQRCRGTGLAAGPAPAAPPAAVAVAAAAAAPPPIVAGPPAGKLSQGGGSPLSKSRAGAAAPVISMVAGQPGSPNRTIPSAAGVRQPSSAGAVVPASVSPRSVSARTMVHPPAVLVTAVAAAGGVGTPPGSPGGRRSTSGGGQRPAGSSASGGAGSGAAAGSAAVAGVEAGRGCAAQQPADAGEGLAAVEPGTPSRALAAAAGGGRGEPSSPCLAQQGGLAVLPPHLALLLHQPGPLTSHSPGPSSPAVRAGDSIAPEAAAVLRRVQLPGEPLLQQAPGSASRWDEE